MSGKILFFLLLIGGTLAFVDTYYAGTSPGTGIGIALGIVFFFIMILGFVFITKQTSSIDIGQVRTEMRKKVQSLYGPPEDIPSVKLKEEELNKIFTRAYDKNHYDNVKKYFEKYY